MGFFNWLFRRRKDSEPTPPVAFQHATEAGEQFVDPGGCQLGVLDAEVCGAADRVGAGARRGPREGGLRAGCYFLNGRCASLEELRTEFARPERIGGVVFYYRENPTGALPPEAKAVLAAIGERGSPVTFAGPGLRPRG